MFHVVYPYGAKLQRESFDSSEAAAQRFFAIEANVSFCFVVDDDDNILIE